MRLVAYLEVAQSLVDAVQMAVSRVPGFSPELSKMIEDCNGKLREIIEKLE